MLSEPQAVTFDGSAKSLARISSSPRGVFRTADGEFELTISNDARQRNGVARREISLARRIPDPTPSDHFDDYREIRNVFGLFYEFDSFTRANSSVDIPLLRTALLAYVDATLQGRIIVGEQ